MSVFQKQRKQLLIGNYLKHHWLLNRTGEEPWQRVASATGCHNSQCRPNISNRNEQLLSLGVFVWEWRESSSRTNLVFASWLWPLHSFFALYWSEASAKKSETPQPYEACAIQLKQNMRILRGKLLPQTTLAPSSQPLSQILSYSLPSRFHYKGE